MRYFLHSFVLTPNPYIELTRSEFEALRSARVALRAAFALEEIYDLLLVNYRELEVSVLSAAVEGMTAFHHEYEDNFALRSGFNRLTLNLLNAARLYLHQFPQWLKEAGISPVELIKRTNDLYDASFQYRFMEALRNHVQHVGLAVHGVSTRAQWLPPNKRDLLEFHVSPYASKASLESDGGFKKQVLGECPDTVPIVPTARSYIGGLSSLHQEARRLVEPVANSARKTVAAAIERHEEQANERVPGLVAIAKVGDEVVDEVPVFLKWDDVRLKLVLRNSSVTNLEKRYVSAQDRGEA